MMAYMLSATPSLLSIKVSGFATTAHSDGYNLCHKLITKAFANYSLALDP
jgi:hypothetical protein